MAEERCENRHTHQYHLIYNTISSVTVLAANTVMKYVTKLADKWLVTVRRPATSMAKA